MGMYSRGISLGGFRVSMVRTMRRCTANTSYTPRSEALKCPSTLQLIKECGTDVRKWDNAFDEHSQNSQVILQSMQHISSLPITPSMHMVCTFLRACFVSKNSVRAVDILCTASSSLPTKVYEMALHVCRNNSDIKSMEKLIDLIASRGIAPWYGYYECLIDLYCNHNNLFCAISALNDLSSSSQVKPNRKIMGYLSGRLLSLAADTNAVKEAAAIVAFMERHNISRNIHFYTNYINLLLKGNRLNEAMEVLGTLYERYPSQKSDHGYSAILTHHARSRNMEAVHETFQLLQLRNIPASVQAYGIYLQCAAAVRDMDKLYATLDTMMKQGLLPDHVTWRIISSQWSKHHDLATMEAFMQFIISRFRYVRNYDLYSDLVCAMYRDAIGTAGRMSQPDKAHTLLLELQYIHKISPDRSVWYRVLRAFAAVGQYSRVVELLSDMKQHTGSADHKCCALVLDAAMRSGDLSPALLSDAMVDNYSKYRYFPEAATWRRCVHELSRRLYDSTTLESQQRAEAGLLRCLSDWSSSRPTVIDLLQSVVLYHSEGELLGVIGTSGNNSVVERLRRYSMNRKFTKCMQYADDWLVMNTADVSTEHFQTITEVLECVFEMCALSETDEALTACRRFIDIASLRNIPLNDTMRRRILQVLATHDEIDEAVHIVHNALREGSNTLASCAIECLMNSSLFYSQQRSYIDRIIDDMVTRNLFCEAAGRRYVLFLLERDNVLKCLTFLQRLSSDEAPRVWEELVVELASRNMLDECFWAWEQSVEVNHRWTMNTYHAIIACCAANERIDDALRLLEEMHGSEGKIPSDMYLPLLNAEYHVCLQIFQHMEATHSSIYAEHYKLLICAAAKSKESVISRVASALRLMEKSHVACRSEAILPVFQYFVDENDIEGCMDLVMLLQNSGIDAYSREACAILRSKEGFSQFVEELKRNAINNSLN